MKSNPPATTLGLLFVSGACSLVYQTLWVKQLGLVIGVDVYAVSIVISGFFLGLALGSYYFAGAAQKHIRPGVLYSKLELATALSSLAVLLTLWFGAPLYVSLENHIGKTAIIVFWLMIALPALFMGGTFLALLRHFRVHHKHLGESVGLLYGANTSGAIIGTIVTPFLLIPLVGVVGSGIFAVTINLALALAARLLLKHEAIAREQPAKQLSAEDGRRKIIALYALIGFAAIAYEVIWGQVLIQFLNTRSHAYAVMLAVYLSGLAAGNFICSRRADKINRPWLAFSVLGFCAAITALLPIVTIGSDVIAVQQAIGRQAFEWTGRLGPMMLAQFLFISVFFIFLPTCCFGAMFPIAAKLADGERQQGTLSSGHALAFNTAGGVIASLLFGFWVIPHFGLVSAIAIVSVLLCGVAALALIYAREKIYLLTVYLAVMLVAISIPGDKFAQLLVEQEGGELLYFAEGVGNTVAVIEQGEGERQFRRLYIEGISNTGDVMASLRYMRLQSYVPLLLFNGEPKSALVIGMGTGITSGALLNYPTLEKRSVIELLPEVVEATRHFEGNYQVVDNPDIEVTVGDGRHQLLRDPQQFDLITLEPPPPTAAGVNKLYSSDFYQLCKKRLSDNGIVAQWWPISTQSVAASKSMVRSMLDSFTYVTLWTTELHEMLLIGSMQPMPLDIDRLTDAMSYPPLSQSLEEVGINSAIALLATYMMDAGGLEEFAGNALPVTDNFPRLEYDTWSSKRVILDILPELLDKQGIIGGLPKSMESTYLFEQEKLKAFYFSGLAAYAGDTDTWQEMLKRLFRAERDNAYYNWFRQNK